MLQYNNEIQMKTVFIYFKTCNVHVDKEII